MVNDETVSGDSPAGEGGLGITHLDSALLLHSEKAATLLFVEAATAYTKDNAKNERSAVLFSPHGFNFYAALLLKKVKSIRMKAIAAEQLAFQDFLGAQWPRKKLSSLSVKPLFLSSISLFSHDSSERRGILAGRARGLIQRLVGVASKHFLPQKETVAMGKGKNRSRPPMTPAVSRRSEKRVWTKPGHPHFGLPSAIPMRKQSRKSRRRESSKMVTACNEPGCEKGVRSRKPRRAQDS